MEFGNGNGVDDDDDVEGVDDPDEYEVLAAWVSDGESGDQGWTQSHYRARMELEDQYDWLGTAQVENTSAADAERVISNFAEDGYDIIFTTSVTFQDSTLEVAEQYPDTYFANANGFNMNDTNMSRYSYRLYQGRYCAGVLAGLLTETDVIGNVGGFAIPLVIRDLNAWALGARSVNEDVTVEARYMNDFYDPPGVRTAVQALADEGVDAVSGVQDSIAMCETAAELEMWATGWASADMGEAAGDWHLVTPEIRWEAYYGPEIEAIRDGTWEPSEYWGGLDDGMVELSDYGPQVPDDAIEEAEAAKEAIIEGELDMWEGTDFEDWSEEPGGEVETEMEEYVDGISSLELD